MFMSVYFIPIVKICQVYTQLALGHSGTLYV